MNDISGATCFVTGGAGFIGSYVAEQLIEQGAGKLFILDNFIRGSKENLASLRRHPRVELIEGDIKQRDLVDEVMSRSDYCFHMAALRINACAANPQEAFDVMVRSTFNVAESARKHNIKKIVYSSSASVYGLAQHFPTAETESPYDNQTLYGAAKLFGEQLFRSYHFMFGLNYVALRYFNVYGPRMDTDGRYTEVMIKWLDCIRDQRTPLVLGDGGTTMDFIFVEDVARANVAALLSDVTNEVFNVGCKRETSLTELLSLLLEVNNSRLQPEYRPDNTVNPVSRRLADVSKAKKLLGFEARTSLEEGLKTLSEWYFGKQGG
jgi:UDP-glucose 4-epimerase